MNIEYIRNQNQSFFRAFFAAIPKKPRYAIIAFIAFMPIFIGTKFINNIYQGYQWKKNLVACQKTEKTQPAIEACHRKAVAAQKPLFSLGLGVKNAK